MNRYKIFEGFAQSVFFADSVSIPRFLLEHYRSLEITNEELVLVMHLLAEPAQTGINPLAQKMGLREDDVELMLAELQKKRILTVHESAAQEGPWGLPRYDFSGLMDQLCEIWGILRYQKMHNDNVLNREGLAQVPAENNTSEADMAQLKLTFEQEFARPLTHMDCDHIRQWVLAGWPPELIIQALRRGVSAGIRTFRYLDSILREWEKKGIRTLEEVEQDDLYFQNKRGKKSRGARGAADNMTDNMTDKAMRAQYEDLYL
ncbi:MAG: DnaD domain protein [Peptococcaceae bacterium]|nr:DnaD domain protein [Peptococcaceae bacterium]